MKIKFRQLNEQERTLIANALLEYPDEHINTHLLSAEMMQSEVVIGTYQYNELNHYHADGETSTGANKKI